MGSLFAAISGLQSSSKWLDAISNNVSNSQTVAFKAGRVSFSDLISQGLRSASGADNTNNLGGISPNQLGLGVTVSSIQNIMTQGALQTTGNATDIAIQGNGFYTVNKGAETLYTRAGNFTFDNQGNLVTTDGGLVQGWSLQVTRAPGAVFPEILSVNTKLDTSNPSNIGAIQVPGNLVLGPRMTSDNAATAVKDQGVIMKANLDSKTPLNPTVAAPFDPTTALQPALDAVLPDVTTTAVVYDSLGGAHTITTFWCQTANTAAPVNAPAQWAWWAFDTSGGIPPTAGILGNCVGGTNVALPANVGALPATYQASLNPVTFNSDGSLANNGTGGLTNPTIILAGAIPPPSMNGAINPQVISFNIGTPNDVANNILGLRDGLTGDFGGGKIDPTTGIYQPVQTIYTAFVDGYSEGTLTGVSVDQTGGINCNFSNNQTVTVAKLAMTNFSNPGGLSKAGGNYYTKTADSGNNQIGTAGSNGFGTTTGGALEQSNVDLTVELTNMIVAQRMFESNARVITAADAVLNALVNLGR